MSFTEDIRRHRWSSRIKMSTLICSFNLNRSTEQCLLALRWCWLVAIIGHTIISLYISITDSYCNQISALHISLIVPIKSSASLYPYLCPQILTLFSSFFSLAYLLLFQHNTELFSIKRFIATFLLEPTNVTPEYLLSCMLSGSYYMPPETLLRSQSSAGTYISWARAYVGAKSCMSSSSWYHITSNNAHAHLDC
jgi:hypothetical protein